MIETSKKFSKEIPFVRIDFYEVNNQIKFKEITFTPSIKFLTDGYNSYPGTKLDIGKLRSCIKIYFFLLE